MKAIFRDTVAEMLSRKVIYLFGFVTLVMLLGVYVTGEISADLQTRAGDEFEVEALIGPLAPWVATAFSKVLTILIFLAVLSTVGLIPGALEKGRAEFYLARPISRTKYLSSKLLSIWIAYGALAVACGLVTYAVASALHGVFTWSIANLFAIYMLDLLIWLCITTLAGVLTGSTVWAMTAAFVIWLAQWLLSFREWTEQLISSKLINYLIDTLYYVIPKTGEIGDLAVALAAGRSIESWLPLWSSLLFAAVAFYLAVTVFKRRNY